MKRPEFKFNTEKEFLDDCNVMPACMNGCKYTQWNDKLNETCIDILSCTECSTHIYKFFRKLDLLDRLSK